MNSKILIIFFLVFFVSCNNATKNSSLDNSVSVIIINNTFIPDDVDLLASQTLTIINQDDISHRIKSADTEDMFIENKELDSDIILPNQTTVLTLPEDMQAGDDLFLFESNLTNTMTTPNLIVHVVE